MRKLLVPAFLLLLQPVTAQGITVQGIARSASLMLAMETNCEEAAGVVPAEANKFYETFLGLGRSAFGQKAFDKALDHEIRRRTREVDVAGPLMWCMKAREQQLAIGNKGIFRDHGEE